MAHGDPRPARTPSREQRSSFFLFFLFRRQLVQHGTSLTSLIFVELLVLVESYVYPWGTTPRNFQAAASYSCAATCQITRKDGAIIDIFIQSIVYFWFDCSPFTACPRAVTLTALQTAAGAFVCANDYRAVHTVQTAQPLAVVCTCELVTVTDIIRYLTRVHKKSPPPQDMTPRW